MAKSDFCFTYYDGDAARDMSHMNRLERGGYTDIIISQRKFGHLSLDQVKKILGRDFEECWGAIELVLKTDPAGKFFIEWLETSEVKAKAHSRKQSENVLTRYQDPTKSLPNSHSVTPLEDGNEDEGGGEPEAQGVQGENKALLIVEAVLPHALDPIYLEAQKLKWHRRVSFDQELEDFRDKVRGSPGRYYTYDADGIRLAFQKHLRSAKPLTTFNGQGKGKIGATGAKFSGTGYNQPL